MRRALCAPPLLRGGSAGLQHRVQHGRAEGVVQADQHVFGRRHFAEQLHVLEGARDAAQRDLRRRAAGDGLAGEDDAAGGRLVDAGQDVHHRALAGAVRADQAVHRAARHVQVDLVQRLQAAELHQDLLDRSRCRRRVGGRRPWRRRTDRRRRSHDRARTCTAPAQQAG
jgi:hypothetical protein